MNVKRFLLTAALIAAVTSLTYGDVAGLNLSSLAAAGLSSTDPNPDLVPKPATMALLGIVLMCLFNWQNRSGSD